MSQESSISRMQELEIEKEKVYSRMEFWNSKSSWVLFSLFSIICCEGGTHTCYVFSIFL